MKIPLTICDSRFAIWKKSAESAASRQSSFINRKFSGAFTMVEIAICLAIIGIALVGILGTLPIGMREQRDNREATVINQDATVFMEAIRGGSRGSDDLTNYVFAITNNQTFFNPGPQTPVLIGFGGGYLTNGANIIGLLSTPEYTDTNGLALPNLSGGGYSNHIVAYVRSMSGSAVEKPPQDNSLLAQDSFTYRVVCGNLPVPMDPSAVTNSAYGAALTTGLHDLRLVFLWPQQPNGQLPPQPWNQTYRTMVAGQLVKYAAPGVNLYFFQPQFFTNAP